MASKIKNIIERTPIGGVLLSSWLSSRGLSRSEQANYVKTGWLKRICFGVYHISTQTPRLYPSLQSISSQSNFKYHIGSITALELKGFSHYGQLGNMIAYVYAMEKWPPCLDKTDWDITPVRVRSNVYKEVGLTSISVDGVDIVISSSERAIFEYIDMIPELANPMDVFYIMEMLTTLRPHLINKLLALASIKTRRLFLYMANKAKHPWFEELNINDVNLGNGDRSITPGGVYDRKYKIVIPKELADYE
ncbi:MAG: type IV toxin-antitoxin system AbiEi family antitoxin [Muribaculaceae bacterium]|nr:type IV toxin-antitoxin system AbiEi family antitoxin [Muribaculaceae bacterium]